MGRLFFLMLYYIKTMIVVENIRKCRFIYYIDQHDEDLSKYVIKDEHIWDNDYRNDICLCCNEVVWE